MPTIAAATTKPASDRATGHAGIFPSPGRPRTSAATRLVVVPTTGAGATVVDGKVVGACVVLGTRLVLVDWRRRVVVVDATIVEDDVVERGKVEGGVVAGPGNVVVGRICATAAGDLTDPGPKRTRATRTADVTATATATRLALAPPLRIARTLLSPVALDAGR